MLTLINKNCNTENSIHKSRNSDITVIWEAETGESQIQAQHGQLNNMGDPIKDA